MAEDTTQHSQDTAKSLIDSVFPITDLTTWLPQFNALHTALLDAEDEPTPDTFVTSRSAWLRTASLMQGPPRPRRAGRRRSRQCRGKRARNYVRAVMREANRATQDNRVSVIVADAASTGALAAAQRLQERS